MIKALIGIATILSSQLILAEELPEEIVEVSSGFTNAILKTIVTTEIPASEIQVTSGFTNPRLIMEIETSTLSKTACTNSRAEAYAIAYGASGSSDTNILHRGYHESILVNCTSNAKYFYVEVILKTASGERFYANQPVSVSSQSTAISRARSFASAIYYNPGLYRLSANTNVSGPGSARVTNYGTITIR